MRALLLLPVLVACRTVSADSGAEDPARPDIVLVLADDLGYADLGFTGCADIPTPAIDRLAAGGVVCTDAHVTASVCAPSRAGLLTGRYQQRQGFEQNLREPGLLEGTTTFAQGLQAAGYRTALVGKWHLGGQTYNHPLEMGFDHFTGLLSGSRSYFPLTESPPGRTKRIERDREVIDEASFDYVTDLFTDEAVGLVGSTPPDQPLFLFVAYTTPHTPMHARPDLEERFAHLEDPRRRRYAALVASLDEGVGRLDAALAERGRDALFVFLSDNGGATNNGSDNGPWRGMKGSKWEGGHRVPFVLRWPGRLAPGTFDEPVSSLDLAATFLAAGRAEPDPEADGLALLPHLDLGTRPHGRLFWRRGVAAAAREGDWKLVRVEARPGVLAPPILVDLATDPGETTDRAADEPARVAHLTALLEAWEDELLPSRWQTGEVWRENQRAKHRMDLIGREAERDLP